MAGRDVRASWHLANKLRLSQSIVIWININFYYNEKVPGWRGRPVRDNYHNQCCPFAANLQLAKTRKLARTSSSISSIVLVRNNYINQHKKFHKFATCQINTVDMIVEKPEDYLFSSARNYAELDNYLDMVVAGHKPLIKNWR